LESVETTERTVLLHLDLMLVIPNKRSAVISSFDFAVVEMPLKPDLQPERRRYRILK
jgi:hypothetical protein